MTAVPFDFGEAKAAIDAASGAQKKAENEVKDAYRLYGEAERSYRRALAQKITELRANGIAVSIAQDLARGDAHVADLRLKRDIKDGLREAAKSAIFRHTADRRELEQLIDWSLRRELAESGPQPQWTRAAA